MRAIGATTSWGVAACVGLILPNLVALAVQQSPQVPAAATAPSAAPAFEVVWQAETGLVTTPQLAVGSAAVFVADESGIRALSADAGKPIWSTDHRASAAMTAGQGVLVVPAADSVRVLDQHTGAERWFAKVAAPAASPAVTAAGIFAAAESVLHGWHLDGTPRWQRALSAPPATAIVAALDPEMLVLGLADRSLLALATADGSPRWQHAVPAVPSAVAVSGGRIYFGGSDGAVYAYDGDGREDFAWRFDVRAQTIGAPVVDERCAYVALIDNTARAFRRGSGNLCWLTPLNLRPAAGPVIIGDDLAVLTATGTLLALEKKTGRLIGEPVTPPGAAPETRPRLLAAAAGADATIYTLTVSSGSAPIVTAFRRKR